MTVGSLQVIRVVAASGSLMFTNNIFLMTFGMNCLTLISYVRLLISSFRIQIYIYSLKGSHEHYLHNHWLTVKKMLRTIIHVCAYIHILYIYRTTPLVFKLIQSLTTYVWHVLYKMWRHAVVYSATAIDYTKIIHVHNYSPVKMH